MSQIQLGRSVDLSRQQIAKYEQGKDNTPLPRLEKIAEVTGKPLSFFLPQETSSRPASSADIQEILSAIQELGDRLSHKANNNVLRFPSRPSLAGLLELPVGAGKVSIDQIREHDVTARIPVEAPEQVDFLITVRGDSMSPLIQDGALLFVRKVLPESFKDGDIAVCYHAEEGEWTCRRIFFHQKEDGLMVGLRSEKTGKTEWKTCEQVHCQGKVVAWENDPRKIKKILEGGK